MRRTSRSMYAVPLRLYSVPTWRPIIESSAKMYSRVIRSAALIGAVVGLPVYLIGSAPLAVVDVTRCFAACAYDMAGTRSRPPSASWATVLTDGINDLRVVGKMYSNNESYRSHDKAAWTALRD